MAEAPEDRFRPRLGTPRQRGRARPYLSRVLRAVERQGANGFGSGRRANFGRGRGAGAMRRWRATGGARDGRRVVVKTRIVKLKGSGRAAAAAHLRYLARDGTSRDGQAGVVYGPEEDAVDERAFLDRGAEDRHQFRIIISPEDGAEIAELKPFIRDLMGQVASDLDTPLDWVAVDHHDTGHPHSHIVIRGKDAAGADLVIARDYIGQGMRARAAELLTLELGPLTARELRQRSEREIEAEGLTGIDRRLLRQAIDGELVLETGAAGGRRAETRAQDIRRLRVLARRGLAVESRPGRWRLVDDLEQKLRVAGQRRDRLALAQRSLARAGLDAGATRLRLWDGDGRHGGPVTGVVRDLGLIDEARDRWAALIEGRDGAAHHVTLPPGFDFGEVPVGAVVSLAASLPVGPADKKIARVAASHGGRYDQDLHRAADPEASDSYLESHARRLRTLARRGLVTEGSDGGWQVPGDLLDRLTTEDRRPLRIETLSTLPLAAQITAEGRTWLDTELARGGGQPCAGVEGRIARAAAARVAHLKQEGINVPDPADRRAWRRHLRDLERWGREAATARHTAASGLDALALDRGEALSGRLAGPVQSGSQRFAVIETGQSFALVPWRRDYARRIGQNVTAKASGGGIEMVVGRTKGLSR